MDTKAPYTPLKSTAKFAFAFINKSWSSPARGRGGGKGFFSQANVLVTFTDDGGDCHAKGDGGEVRGGPASGQNGGQRS